MHPACPSRPDPDVLSPLREVVTTLCCVVSPPPSAAGAVDHRDQTDHSHTLRSNSDHRRTISLAEVLEDGQHRSYRRGRCFGCRGLGRVRFRGYSRGTYPSCQPLRIRAMMGSGCSATIFSILAFESRESGTVEINTTNLNARSSLVRSYPQN